MTFKHRLQELRFHPPAWRFSVTFHIMGCSEEEVFWRSVRSTPYPVFKASSLHPPLVHLTALFSVCISGVWTM
uniref:Uncharacterized protein n=1 Tax=Anguilla anguilla TaxID=7936 RepID=A0A0E9RL56_ANGAN